VRVHIGLKGGKKRGHEVKRETIIEILCKKKREGGVFFSRKSITKGERERNGYYTLRRHKRENTS